MEENTTTAVNLNNIYFTRRHILFYLFLIPAIIVNYLIFNLVLTNSENLNILFNFKELVKLVVMFSITLSFAGVTLYFLKKIAEIVIVSILLTIPIFFVSLSIDQTLIATFASFITFLVSGLLIKNRTQKYIIPNIKEQVTLSFKHSTILLNFSLTFIFFTQVSFIEFDTWIGQINKVLTPITNAVTKEVERSLFPQKMLIGQAQNLGTSLMELDVNQFGKAITINEIGEVRNSEMLSIDQLLDTPSPADLIKNEIKTALTPYSQFIPFIATFLAFINYQIVINISILLSSFLITIIIFLLKLTKVIIIKKELKEVLTYEI